MGYRVEDWRYMLGLCYRNGYGVEQDTARASFYLGRSATLGFRPAMEEQYRKYPENCLDNELSGAAYGNVPSLMPEIHPAVNDTSRLYGRYRGFVAMYDWSGTYLLGEKPVEMDIRREAPGKANGVMVLSGDTIPFCSDVTADGRLVFSKGKLKLAERYTVNGKASYRMDNALLDVWNDRIAADASRAGAADVYGIGKKWRYDRTGHRQTAYGHTYCPQPVCGQFQGDFRACGGMRCGDTHL